MNKKIIGIVILGIFLISNLSSVSAVSINKEAKNRVIKQSPALSTNVGSSSQQAEWTVMVYMAADNDGEDYAMHAFGEMAKVDYANGGVNIVVQLDRRESECHRFFVEKGMTPVESNAIEDWGDGSGGREINTADPQTLIDFVTWAATNYSAEHYGLILFDKASFYSGTPQPTRIHKNFCQDDTSGSDGLEITELRTALDEIVTDIGVSSLDFIGFDADYMQLLEIGYEIASYSTYLIASQQSISSDGSSKGFNYYNTLRTLVENPIMPPSGLVKQFVNDYRDYGKTLSAINISLFNTMWIEDLKHAVSELAISLQIEDHYRTDFEKARRSTSRGYWWNHPDLYGLCESIKEYIGDPIINSNAQTVMDEVKRIVISEVHDLNYSGYHGVSIYFPSFTGEYNLFFQLYKEFLFAADSQWDDFIEWFYLKPNRAPNVPNMPSGPISGKVGKKYEYTFVTTDPDNDKIYYKINWGDGITDWIGPYNSGEEVNVSHVWDYPSSKMGINGIYPITVDAQDELDHISGWSDSLKVEIKRRWSSYNMFLLQFPWLAQVLRFQEFTNSF